MLEFLESLNKWLDWSDFWESFFKLLEDIIFGFWDMVLSIIASVIDAAAAILPTWNPLGVLQKVDDHGFLNALNWVFPVDHALTCIQAFLWSTVAYYTVGSLARWAKLQR